MNHSLNRHLILDFGMHRGEDTEFYLKLGAKVISFEANNALVEANKTRFRQEVENGQLEIIEGAITAPDFQGEKIAFYVDRKKSIWGTTKVDWVNRNEGLGTSVDRIEVQAVKLFDILAKYETPYYVKIDIEGADRDVLATLLASDTCPDFLSIESSKMALDEVAKEIDMLCDLGYTRFAAVQQGIIPGSTYYGKTLCGQQPLRYRFRRHSSGRFGPMLQQDYKTSGEIMDEYRKIFHRYEMFGDKSWFMQSQFARVPTRIVNRVLSTVVGQPLCGWFDTHACR